MRAFWPFFPMIFLAALWPYWALPRPISWPLSEMMLRMSPFSNWPSILVMPIGSRLIDLSLIILVVQSLMWTLALPSAMAIHFFTCFVDVFLAGNSLPCGLVMQSGFCPFTIKVLVPRLASFWAMFSFVDMPPRPISDFSWVMCFLLESLGFFITFPLSSKIPSTDVSRNNWSTFIIEAIRPASSSLSVNMISLTEMTSFSFTIGTILSWSRAWKQFCMFR